MDWAQQRAWMVISVLAAVVISFLAILGFSIFYNTPTCTDGKQNGEETGRDCGGSCAKVCSMEAEAPRVRFARPLIQSGRVDLIAHIDNPNTDAYAKDARVTIDIFREDGRMLQKHALITLPAKSSTPLYIPGVAGDSVQQIFVSFDEGTPAWTKGEAWSSPAPKASNISVQSADTRPRITATITNQTAYADSDVPLVATVFAADGSIVAASQTVLSYLPPQGSAQAVFTWNEPFDGAYARVEVVPLIALPRLVP